MVEVINNTARQFNLKCYNSKNEHVKLRLIPGVNVVDETLWSSFVKPEVNDYVRYLKDNKFIDFKETKVKEKVKDELDDDFDDDFNDESESKNTSNKVESVTKQSKSGSNKVQNTSLKGK